MNRRQFCGATLGVAAAHSLLAGRALALPTVAEADIPAVSLDRTGIVLEKAAVNELAEALSGELLVSGHPAYDNVRQVWNAMHDKHPALIARCRDSRDISHAINFARERDLLVAVRGGGHSWPGKSVCEGGLMIDLSLMKFVSVDPRHRSAFAEGGALLHGLDTESREHGLITTAGVVSHTGVAGFTLGGGFGRLNRKFGLAVDNLKSAEIVTADGQIRRISAKDEPDLFWAIRGGGGNFGVVSEFEYALHPLPLEVYSGNIVWPIDQAHDVLHFYADWYSGLSDDLYVGPAMLTLPDGTAVVVMEVVYAGDPARGEKELAPLLEVGEPLDNGIAMHDYMMMQTQEDDAFAHGVRSYAKSGMVREVTHDLVDTLLDAFVSDPRLAFFTHTSGGAVKRVDELATAFPHRNAESMLAVGGAWTDPADDEKTMATAREWFSRIEPHTGGYYTNIDYDGDGAPGNYGPAYGRLARIKAKHDPANLFRLNSNVEPAAGNG